MGKRWVRSLTFENVKPFSGKQTIRFGKGINVIAGPPKSGKSVLLYAIGGAWYGELLNFYGAPWSNDSRTNFATGRRMDNGDYRIRLETNKGVTEIVETTNGALLKRVWTRSKRWSDKLIAILDEYSLRAEVELAESRAEVSNSGRGKLATSNRGSGGSKGTKISRLLKGFCDSRRIEVFLLDDIFTGLDAPSRATILDCLTKLPCQVILTTSAPEAFPSKLIRARLEVLPGGGLRIRAV